MSDFTEAGSPFSTEVSLFDASDGGAIVHLPLQGRAFKVSERGKEVIEALRAGRPRPRDSAGARICHTLESMGVLGGNPTPVPRTAPVEEFRPVEATLIFTETCNLGCSYCYASSTAAKSPSMSPTIARAAVDLVVNNAALTEENLAMFRYIGGGEPTIDWPLLTETTSYIERTAARRYVRHFIRLITNGTLLTRDRVSWLAEHVHFVTLSFDILPEFQALRKYNNGRNSHDKVLRVVQDLTAQGVEFHLRCTVSSAAAGHLREMVQYVHDNTGAKSVRFEPMSEIGRSLDEGLGKPRQAEFVESFKEAYRLGRRLGIAVTCKQFSNDSRRSARFCAPEFSVAPSGVVTACHRYSREDHDGYDIFRIGHFDGESFHFDLDRLNKLRSIDVHTFAECNTCIARWNCAGGCLSARVGPKGISQKGPLCDLTRDLLKFSIEERVVHGVG